MIGSDDGSLLWHANRTIVAEYVYTVRDAYPVPLPLQFPLDLVGVMAEIINASGVPNNFNFISIITVEDVASLDNTALMCAGETINIQVSSLGTCATFEYHWDKVSSS